ncbi:hypothetical protein [Microbacterium azadirachtae]|uniref:hypothetical protein n=1 Tax=Microbacterium azadirachtae TaxID=582680 RepID=UPI0035B5008B
MGYDVLTVQSVPGLTFTTYLTEPGTPSADALDMLRSWVASQEQERASQEDPHPAMTASARPPIPARRSTNIADTNVATCQHSTTGAVASRTSISPRSASRTDGPTSRSPR